MPRRVFGWRKIYANVSLSFAKKLSQVLVGVFSSPGIPDVFSSCKHAGMTGNTRKNLLGLYCENIRVNAWKTRNIVAEKIRKINILPHSSPDCGSELTYGL
jgi:hypothetical protein